MIPSLTFLYKSNVNKMWFISSRSPPVTTPPLPSLLSVSHSQSAQQRFNIKQSLLIPGLTQPSRIFQELYYCDISSSIFPASLTGICLSLSFVPWYKVVRKKGEMPDLFIFCLNCKLMEVYLTYLSRLKDGSQNCVPSSKSLCGYDNFKGYFDSDCCSFCTKNLALLCTSTK